MPVQHRALSTLAVLIPFCFCAGNAHAKLSTELLRTAPLNPPPGQICNDLDGDVDEGFDADGDGFPDCADPCPMLLDFDIDTGGDTILPGQDLSEAYADWDIHIAVYEQDGINASLGIAFDTSDPTGGDFDLGTPNADFGGSGVGDGGAAGAAGQNDVPGTTC